MKFLILFLVAMAVSSIGFKKFIWFISIGYGFSIAALGVAIPALFLKHLTVVTGVMSVLLILYGIRLGGYLFLRETKSAAYRNTVKNDMVDGAGIRPILKVITWAACAFLYCCETAPIFFRLSNGQSDDVMGFIGLIIMALGLFIESLADYTKNKYKKKNPGRFCDVGLYRFVRCPNYLGEILTWLGVFLSGVTIYEGVFQWGAGVFGLLCIIYIMFGGARRLELRQNKNYGANPEYQNYCKSVPILIPWLPLYSVSKYKWLVG